jgi:hypothetical protein
MTATTALLALLGLERLAAADPMSTSPEQAYDLGQMPNAQTLGMGGAGDALGVSTAALTLNPANMAMARVYHADAFAAFSPQAQRQTYGLAAVDSVLNSRSIAGGIAGTWSQFDPGSTKRTWTDLRAAIAFPLLGFLSLGATLRWLRVDQATSSGPFGPSYASDGNSNGPVFNNITIDAGASAALGDSFRVGLSGHNLTNPGTALAPTTMSGGLGFCSPECPHLDGRPAEPPVIIVEGDGLLDFTSYASTRGRLMGGGTLLIGNRFEVRGGWRYDTGTKLNSPSLGFGYVDPSWSVELSVRHDLTSDHAMTYGVLQLRYAYDPFGSGGGSQGMDQPDMLQ